MRMNCEILDLKAFLTVLDAGGFQNAALQLNMSQPTVSRRVKALEATLGVTLLQRTTRHITLTGDRRKRWNQFAAHCVRVREMQFFAGRHRPAVGKNYDCFHSDGRIDRFFLVHSSGLRLPTPDVHCRIIDLSAEEGLERVVGGEAEFGINFLGQSRSDLRFTPLINDDFVVACRGDHEFAAKKFVRWRDLTEHPLIISQRSGNRTLVDHALSAGSIRLNWSYE